MRAPAELVLALGVLAGLVVLACTEPPPDLEPELPVREDAKPMMGGLVGSATTLLPLSLKDGGFSDPANQAAISTALRAMDAHVTGLQDYAWGQDEGFAWLSRSLGRDVGDARRAFDARRYDEARFRVQRLTVNCVACHSRLPADQESDLGDRLFASIDTKTMHPDELAQLQQATRQFEAAATTYEGLLKEVPKDQNIARIWYFVDYLVLSVRVLGDLERPKAILAPYVDAKQLPSFVQRDVAAWLSALEDLSKTPVAGDGPREAQLERARGLIKQARTLSGSPSGREGLVHWIVASSLLNRYVEGRPERSAELAEAYWMLGLAEARIGHSPWLSQAEYYLEAAVRAAPETTAAREALALLEWHLAVEYTGSGGERIPADVQAQLDALRTLVEQATRAPK